MSFIPEKPQPTAVPGAINGDAFDRFTFAHAGVGAVLGYLRAPWWTTMGFALAWEIVERPLKDNYPGVFPNATQDTVPNAITDVAAVMVGWALTRRALKGKR